MLSHQSFPLSVLKNLAEWRGFLQAGWQMLVLPISQQHKSREVEFRGTEVTLRAIQLKHSHAGTECLLCHTVVAMEYSNRN